MAETLKQRADALFDSILEAIHTEVRVLARRYYSIPSSTLRDIMRIEMDSYNLELLFESDKLRHYSSERPPMTIAGTAIYVINAPIEQPGWRLINPLGRVR